ncbi:MAG: hypothetical protein MZV63_15720 [Marinilabiliales bacterium]|nr:hypothetical protein [Marinilabiliales bacterium]
MNWGISVLIVNLIIGNAMNKPKTDIWSDEFNKQLRKSIDTAHEVSYLERLRTDRDFRLRGDKKEAKEMPNKLTPEEYAKKRAQYIATHRKSKNVQDKTWVRRFAGEA